MDPANVAMFGLYCSYTGSKAETKIMVNLKELGDIIKKTFIELKINTITLSFGPINSNSYNMRIKGGDIEVNTTVEKPYEKEQKIPKLKFKAEFKIKKLLFNKYLKAIKNVGQSIMMISKDKYLNFKTNLDTNNLNIKKIIKGKGHDCKSLFSTEYLDHSLIGPYPVIPGKEITIYLGADYPLRIEDEFGNWLVLAPRVDYD